jgi:tRNA dimethylallyltransferase
MLSAGLLKEVEQLKARGLDRKFNALNTVGYAEAFAFLEGEITEAEMIRLFKQNSRRYAKRQMTWFRPDKRIQWIRMSEEIGPVEAAGEIFEHFHASPYRKDQATREIQES